MCEPRFGHRRPWRMETIKLLLILSERAGLVFAVLRA
jgi:hypothetical protein